MPNKHPPPPRTRPDFRVLVKATWSADSTTYVEVPYLEPISATACVAPTIPSARFLYRTGRIKREDQSAFSDQSELNLEDTYIRIEWLDPVNNFFHPPKNKTVWDGIVPEDALAVGGAQPGPYGDQIFTAFGLEHVLDRISISTARAVNETGDAFAIGYCPAFNDRFIRGVSEIGNQSLAKYPGVRSGTSYVFGPDVTTPSDTTQGVWSNYDIVEYLLANFAPADIPFDVTDTTNLDEGFFSGLNAIVLPRVELEGMTLRAALNHLIDRRRGFGWVLRLINGTPTVWIYSVFKDAVAVGTGSVGGNVTSIGVGTVNTGRVTIANDLLFSDYSRTVSTQNRYGRIRVIGERVKSCFSLSFINSTLTEGWTAAEETMYLTAAGEIANPAKNDRYRADDRLQHVYTTFKLPDTWNWMAGDATTPDANKNANPTINADGSNDPTTPAPIRQFGHQLLHHLPLKKDVDLDINGFPLKLLQEFREPFALVRKELTTPQYEYVHVISDGADRVGGHVRPLDSAFGIEVKLHPAHLLAKGKFRAFDQTAGAANAKPSEHLPIYDYTKMIVTVAAETDTRLAVALTIAGAGTDTELLIRVPDAEFWYIVPGTVTGIDNTGSLVKQGSSPTACVLRDDSDRLKAIAKLAKTWYGMQRSVVSFRVEDIVPDTYLPGDMIYEVDGGWRMDTVNTVITRRAYDFPAAATLIETGFAELDVTAGERREVLE